MYIYVYNIILNLSFIFIKKGNMKSNNINYFSNHIVQYFAQKKGIKMSLNMELSKHLVNDLNKSRLLRIFFCIIIIS